MLRTVSTVLMACALMACTLPGAGALAAAPETPVADKTAQVADADAAKAPVAEQATSKHGSVEVNGRDIGYTATAGTLTLRNEAGAPVASMFYVAYVADGHKNDAKRPVTFLFNGGPGSSSLWLNVGSFGPMRVKVPGPDAVGPAPYDFGPNAYSLIDKTDLVFIDAMSTGLSRPLGKAEDKDFWGVDKDVDCFRKAILRYLSISKRWNSPKFLLGESYGTTRAAGLAYALEDAGAPLNGVILLSSFLNTSMNGELLYANYLPSYAATAWYHHKLADRPAALAPFLDKVRAFAHGAYLAALIKGDDLPADEAKKVAEEMSRYTGLSAEFILRCHLRVDLDRFRKELLRNEGLTVGRFDSRFTGKDADNGGAGTDYDASDTGINGAFISALHRYLFDTLGYKTELTYRPGFYDGLYEQWSWMHRTPSGGEEIPANMAGDLGQAMRIDPYLKVLSLNGYYDLATPFFNTEYDLKHMQIDATRKKNLSFAYYESGHMAYLRLGALKALHRDIAAFIDGAVRK